MTVKELFTQCLDDIPTLYAIYTSITDYFSDDYEASFSEKVKASPRLLGYIKQNAKQIADADISQTPKDYEPHTIFMFPQRSLHYPYEEEGYSIFCIRDEDAFAVVDKNFSVWNNDGEVYLEHYAFDFTPINELARHLVSEDAVKKYGVAGVCAYILQDLLFWGLDEATREKRKDELIDDLNRSKESLKNEDAIPADQVFDELEKELYKDATEDEKEHRKLKKQYNIAVKEIEDRKRQHIFKKDHEKLKQIIRAEYKRRVGQNH